MKSNKASISLYARLIILSIKCFYKDTVTGLSIFKQTLRSINSLKKYSKRNHPILKTLNSQLDSNSDTVFILGSGPSINEMKDADWQFISNEESWAFNFWFCHKFIPKKYFLQSPISSSSNEKYLLDLDILMTKMFLDKKNEYGGVKFILRGDGVNSFKFHNTNIGKTILQSSFEYYFASELIVRSMFKIAPKELIKKIFSVGFFSKSNQINPIPKFGSTIGELISLALILGYKKIVLCGIDMNDGGHFYDSQLYFDNYPFLKSLSEINRSKTKHEHMDRSLRTHTVKDVIFALNDLAKESFSAKIFISSQSSSLYPDLEKFNFNK